MALQDDEFLARLLQTFSEEATDHIQTIVSGILVLEQNPEKNQSEEIEPVYRACHSLKGAARAVGLREIETLCQNLETLFSVVRKKELILQNEDFDLIHQVIGVLEQMLGGNRSVSSVTLIKQIKEKVAASGGPVVQFRSVPVSQEPEVLEKPPSLPSEKDIAKPIEESDSVSFQGITKVPASSIRISEERLKNLYSTADDLLSYRLSSGSRLSDLKMLSQRLQAWRWSLNRIEGDIALIRRMDLQNPESVNRVLAFIDNTRDMISGCETELSAGIRTMNQDQNEMDTVITGLIESIREVVLIPVSSLTDTYPRMIRDIAKEQNKEINFSVSGDEVEIDRRVLDIIRDPLLHLIRNAIDHGIESPEKRTAQGKNLKGKLSVQIEHHRANQIRIRISDDGQGIDPEKISASAVSKGFLSKDELSELDDKEKTRLIFKSGLSTAQIVTEMSGRGLGLAIVQEKINQVGGSVHVTSNVQQGTVFTLKIPVSLATFRGVMVYTENRPFFIPLKQIIRVLNPESSDLSTIEGRMFISYEEEMIPVGFLGSILGISNGTSDDNEGHSLVIVKCFNGKIGVFVQRIAGAEEIVIRSLGPQLKEVRFISGVAILNSTMVVPVLHMEDVANAMQGQMQSDYQARETTLSLPGKRKILVAEDSITSRMLIKNILEGSGYDVETAVDGLDAFTKLKASSFDLVVSDVDMPRMNGFILTEKIRGEKNLSDLPIILVTSLDSREDREHGIQVGANAYIIKSTFDQGNLLEVIKRLIVTGR